MGTGHEHIGLMQPGLFPVSDTGSATHDNARVQLFIQKQATIFVLFHHHHIMPFADQTPGDIFCTLASSGKKDAHNDVFLAVNLTHESLQ